jgi:hypothetical protein
LYLALTPVGFHQAKSCQSGLTSSSGFTWNSKWKLLRVLCWWPLVAVVESVPKVVH